MNFFLFVLCFLGHFTYLDKGSQAYVYISDDGQSVLKKFRYERFHISLWLTPRHSPKFLKKIYDNKRVERQKKWEELLESARIASLFLKEESGILSTHLEAKEPYLIQKRADPLNIALLKCKKEGNLQKAKSLLSDVIALIRYRQSLNIGDKDPALVKNIGVTDRVIFLDVGSFFWDEHPENQKELKKMLFKLGVWISKNYPDLYPYFLYIFNNSLLEY